MLQRACRCHARAASHQTTARRFAMRKCDKRAIAAQFVIEGALVPSHLQHNARSWIFIPSFER